MDDDQSLGEYVDFIMTDSDGDGDDWFALSSLALGRIFWGQGVCT